MGNGKKLSKSFDLGTAASLVLVAFGVQVVFQLIVSLFPLAANVRTWIIVVGNQLVFFGAVLVFARLKAVDPLAIAGAKEPPKWYYFPLFVLIAIACVTCFAPMSGLFRRLLGKLGYDYMPQYYIPREPGTFTLAFLGLTLLPVIGEEFMLRGALMSGAKKRSPLFAILYTALIFALLHGNLNQLIHQFLLGAVMGYLAYLTGGIYASAAVHMTNNAVALLLDYGFAHNFINHKFYYYIAGELGATETLVGISLSFFGLVLLLVLVTCLMHRERSQIKDYFSVEGSVGDKITAYLIYLSTPTVEREKEAMAEIYEEEPLDLDREDPAISRRRRPMESYTLLMVILLAAVLGAIVLLSLIPGVN